MTTASSTGRKMKGAYALFKRRFEVSLGCMTIRTQIEIMIRRVQVIRRTKKMPVRWKCQKQEDVTQNMGTHS